MSSKSLFTPILDNISFPNFYAAKLNLAFQDPVVYPVYDCILLSCLAIDDVVDSAFIY